MWWKKIDLYLIRFRSLINAQKIVDTNGFKFDAVTFITVYNIVIFLC